MDELQGRTVWTVAPHNQEARHHIYYLHGGSYLHGFSRLHWSFICRLVRSGTCTVIAPDYPLSPAHDISDVFSMVFPICRDLIARVGATNMTIMGDSAGGGMGLALAQQLKHAGLQQPANLMLLSPWLDATMTNPEIQATKVNDPILDVDSLIEAGRLSARCANTTDPLISPINGSLTGLAPITVFIGTHDLLMVDCRTFRVKAEAAGIALDYREYEGMIHEWMMFPLPESEHVMSEIIDKLPRP